MKFNYNDHSRDNVGWAFILAFGKLPKEQQDKILYEEIVAGVGEVELELRINGREVNFVEVMQFFFEATDEIAEGKAKRIVEERAASLYKQMNTLQDRLKDEINKIFPSCYDEQDY